MIHITTNIQAPVESLPFELVERKGIGHPDTLCDAIAEKASQYYSQYFLKAYGKIAHHWFDKVMLIGGSADISFGKGIVTKPYRIVFAGKAVKQFQGQQIPLDDILRQAVIDVLSKSLTGFDPNSHFVLLNEIIDYHGAGRENARYRPKSYDDLVAIDQTYQVSNDCNLLSAYAPLSRLEQLVLQTEQFINGSDFKRMHPETGWDVKIVGYREIERFMLLINLPFIASQVDCVETYFQKKTQIIETLECYFKAEYNMPIELKLNPQDDHKHYYLTALGSVADTGDVGVVGRGNRINGLITPMRPMSIEAPAGKNPIDHTGKLYGILANKLAKSIYMEIGKPVEINIFTAKESAIGKPDHLSVLLTDWSPSKDDQEKVTNIVLKHLSNATQLIQECVLGDLVMW